MLKALELIGFKSFADKTRFVFPPGITVVVGPNGSGKSNVVDAIKWVLGEQSVKSLRGKEMADVIFNGSGSRRAVNTAEATLTFDNSQGLLAVDTPDVQITRRVYRSGEGEYLINRQPCRLRDIRDLFAGTGAATEAYSVIEQGKVDVLLQSSPRDRRMIFEEAAGISRFKAKKTEALRRLERVDQNLLRLSDIVEEVENRLRSVRMQAGKAKRYKEYTDRLQELRTQVGLTDWRKLTEQLAGIEAELQAKADQAAEQNARLEVEEAELLALETTTSEVDVAVRACETKIAGNREQIAALESTIDHQRTRSLDFDDEMVAHRQRLHAMQGRAGDLDFQLQNIGAALEEATSAYAGVKDALETDERLLGDATRAVEALRQQFDQSRRRHTELLRQSGALGSRIGELRTQASNADTIRSDRQEKLTRLRADRDALSRSHAEFRDRYEQLAEHAQQCSQSLEEHQEKLTVLRRAHAESQRALSSLQGKHTGAVERAAVLDELEKRLEGLSTGVKEILRQARESSDGPLRYVRGLVADVIHVSVDTAPLVEIALGELAHYLIVAPGADLVSFLEEQSSQLPGRVGFVHADAGSSPGPVDRINLENQPGVLGRADRFVETSPEFIPLVRRLLGRTWFVETLTEASRLAQGSGRGLHFVTLSGQRLSAEGTVAAGPRSSATGLISRRSELRSLRATIFGLEEQIRDLTAKVEGLEQDLEIQDKLVETSAAANSKAAESLGAQRVQLNGTQERLKELNQRHDALEEEIGAADASHQTATVGLEAAQEKCAAADAEIEQIEQTLRQSGDEIGRLERQRDQLTDRVSAKQVKLAKAEQTLESFRRQLDQLEREGDERGKAVAEIRAQLDNCRRRRDSAQQTILRAESEVASLYLEKDDLAKQVLVQLDVHAAAQAKRIRLTASAQEIRNLIRKLESKIHAQQLAAGDVRHRRATMQQRLKEDYDIELASLQYPPTDEELHEREAVEDEIADLRRKINNIGNVNLEALAELADIESRFGSLSAQFEDLTRAKASLEQIIGRINADSRRLFAETLELVRGHFQTLFRKLFGGGQADIVLDDEQDILESGIEIVARPPGKEPRSISLLSGGEKTLTCVALLMAIFKSRPSPFCVLDEVDAALDEANIERFVGVLKEFLTWTQFIIITHSKKTMTCAGTLYGVTMQESGISKRVSVRFEDVSEDGQIQTSALQRDDASEPREESSRDVA